MAQFTISLRQSVIDRSAFAASCFVHRLRLHLMSAHWAHFGAEQAAADICAIVFLGHFGRHAGTFGELWIMSGSGH
jgi:hypothetical protein